LRPARKLLANMGNKNMNFMLPLPAAEGKKAAEAPKTDK
jgi:hypothetical protein